mgnify:CR=1 FL=1
MPSLLVIPVGLAIVKAAVDKIEDDKSGLTPFIPPAPVTPVTPIVPLIPTFTEPQPVTPPPPDPGPSKFRIEIPEGVIPFFPEQTGVPPKGVNIDPTKFPKIGDISSLNFQTGLFDPAVQARLRAKQ